MARRLPFASDYMESAHPAVLAAVMATAGRAYAGYGTDELCESARLLIREACEAPDAEVHFLAGGTQANATMVDVLLAPWQGVVCVESGHIATHEAGAIEASGHKVLTLPAREGKLDARALEAYLMRFEADENRDHEVWPGLVYLSQPTELGTLYTRAELEEVAAVAHGHGLRVYVDGARLAYALASPLNDVSLADLARLADAFYIGGTKCGALFGEAVVVPASGTVPHLFTLVKRHGALLAKGWAIGSQFRALFMDGLYGRLGDRAVRMARAIAEVLEAQGYLAAPPQTNQVFATLPDAVYERLSAHADIAFWDRPDGGHTTVRIATSWATSEDDVDALVALVRG